MITINVEKTASRGIVIGKAFLYEKPNLMNDFCTIKEQDIQKEIERFERAVKTAETELDELGKTNPIFLAHLEMVKDPTLYEGVVSKIRDAKMNADSALEVTMADFIQVFESLEDEYMRERAADMKDIKHRLFSSLHGIKNNALENITEEVILIAEDLTPSETACLNLKYILGFITRDGGVTSHVSIMAKGLEIPSLIGVQDILKHVKNDDMIIMDASAGKIFIHPEEETIKTYKAFQREQEEKHKELLKINDLPAITLDEKSVTLCANIGNLDDLKNALKYNIDGVGLFRTEFLYMDHAHFPTEEEQFNVYKEAANLCSKELTIRTLDIGGDKELSYFEFEKEENPFLGWRAIRISLQMRDMFKTQLRAILRASAYGMIRIMFPMIVSLEELREAKEVLDECREELRSKNITFDPNIEVGMMIETPSSVILAEDFACEVDFFSIGTNDLTQYLLAVDRGNKKIAHMYNSFHPSIIRSIRKVIDAGHKNNIKVGMCGEFASDENAVKLLLGLGLDEFSMSSSQIVNTKNMIRNSYYNEAQELARKVCKAQTIDEIYNILGIKG